MSDVDFFEVPLSGRGVKEILEASAGTGKTYAITALVARAVSLEGVPIDKILVMTFTRAATQELRDRIRARFVELYDALSHGAAPKDPFACAWLARVRAEPEQERVVEWRLKRAIEDIDLAEITTIHGFCSAALRQMAFEAGMPLERELLHDVNERIRTLSADFFIRAVQEDHPEVVEAMRKWFGPSSQGASTEPKPSAATEVAKKVASSPTLPVYPPALYVRAEASDVMSAEAGVELANATFEARRAEAMGAIKVLFEAEGLNGSKTKPEHKATATAALTRQRLSRKEADWFYNRFTHDGIVSNGTMKTGFAPPDHPGFAVWEAWLDAQRAYHEAVERRVVQLRADFAEELTHLLPAELVASGVQSFDGMLADLYTALKPDAAATSSEPALATRAATLRARLRDTYALVFVDEFQDTDPVQCGVFEEVFAGEVPLFYVGDPKQAIYKFRGADIHAYLAATRDAEKHQLGTNYRSDPGVVESVNALFSRVPAPFGTDAIAFHPVASRPNAQNMLRECDKLAPSFRIATLDPAALNGDEDEGDALSADSVKAHLAAWTANDIVRQLRHTKVKTDDGERSLKASDFAVLVKSHAQGARVQEQLRLRGVPSVRTSGERVLEPAEAADLRVILAAVAQPYRGGQVRAALATETLGKRAEELAELLDDAGNAWDAEVEHFARARQRWEAQGVLAAIVSVLTAYDVQPRLLRLPGGERRMTNVMHAAEEIHLAATTEQLGMAEVLRWLGTPQLDGAELRAESDGDAVQLMTIHKSKGLEFSVVYCPFLLPSRYPKSRDAATASTPCVVHMDGAPELFLGETWLDHEGSAARIQAAKREAVEESARLAYVALTRAKHQVVLSSVHQRSGKRLVKSVLSGLFYGLDAYASYDGAQKQQKRTGDEWYAAASAWAMSVPGGVAVHEEIEADYSLPYEHGTEESAALEARTFARKLRAHRVTSFSGLKGDKRSADAPVRDRDDDVQVDEAVDTAPRERLARVLTEEARMHGVGGGTSFGNFVHETLEKAPFQATDRDELRSEVERSAERFGVAGRHLDGVTAWLARTLDTPLDAAGFCLAQLDRGARIDEMEFWLPVGHHAGDARLVSRIAEAIEAYSKHPSAGAIAARIGALDAREVRGYLRGFIDLVYVHEGRWWLVDYKTNRLSSAAAYASDALGGTMAETLYGLQYHLYAVALHRYLRRALEGYDPSAHFGGARYLFMRGMHPDLGPDSGVFYDPMSPALLAALDDAIGGGER